MNKGELDENDLQEAVAYAILEADRWYKIGEIVEKENMYPQNAVIKLLASELYLKSILLHNGYNITKIKELKNKHSLKILYDYIDEKSKEKIELYAIKELEKVNIFFPIKIIDPVFNEEICIYSTFKEALTKIANDFVELRYDYDKLTNKRQHENNSTIILYSFISVFEKSLKRLAYEIYNKK